MWKCTECKKEFPHPGRWTREYKQEKQEFYTKDKPTRETLEVICCPYCKSMEIKEIKPE